MRALIRRILYWARRRRMDAELSEEIQTHHSLKREALERAGIPRVDAVAEAHRVLGNLTLAREDARAVWLAPWLEGFWQDVRISVRALRKRRGISAIIVATMALGIGANTAVFSLLDASLFRTLPAPHPEQIVFLSQVDSTGSGLGFSNLEVERLRDGTRTLSAIVAYDGTRFSAVVAGQPALLSGEFVSGNYFALLGARAAAGRTFTGAEDRPGAQPVAVISGSYRTRAFGIDASAVGKVVNVGGIPFTIIGVMPADFRGRYVSGPPPDLIVPMAFHKQLALRDHQSFGIVARLNPSVEIAQAAADIDAVHRQFLNDSSGTALSPAAARDIASRRTRVRSGLHGENGTLKAEDARQTIIVISIVALTLLIACLNVASLLLARAADRQKEMAVRLSIGAGRGRLMRQLLTESIVLAGAGGAIGLLCSESAAGVLRTMLPLSDLTFHPATNPACLAFTFALAVGTGLIFGLVPAFSSTRLNLSPILRGTDAGSAGPHRHRMGGALVVGQIALSLTLLVAAGLLVQSLRQLHRAEPGFAAERVVNAYIYPTLLGTSHDREMQEYGAMLDRLKAMPGIQSASVMRGWIGSRENQIGPDFFATLGVSFVRGRDFSRELDLATSQKVAIVSESAARLLFGDADPIGREVPSGGFAKAVVVGVVRDIRHSAWQETGDATVYAPYTQADSSDLGQIHLLVRTAGDPVRGMNAIRSAIRAIDPNLPIVSIQTIADELGQSVAGEVSIAKLLSWFGALALTLALIGLYGTISNSVTRRTRELAIRISLGADADDIVRAVLLETFRLIAIGAVIGVALAIATGRVLRGLLFHTAAADPLALTIVLALTVTVGLLAGLLPAYRAARVSPMIALRHG